MTDEKSGPASKRGTSGARKQGAELEDLFRMIASRPSDPASAADEIEVQAARCVAVIKSHSWRTSATMIAAAVVMLVAGVFQWGSHEHARMLSWSAQKHTELQDESARANHTHRENVLSREHQALRDRIAETRRHLEALEARFLSIRSRSPIPLSPPPGPR